MDTRILSDNMIKLVNIIETMKPYEGVFIQADAQGKPDSFVVSRSTKIVLIAGQPPKPVASKPKMAGD